MKLTHLIFSFIFCLVLSVFVTTGPLKAMEIEQFGDCPLGEEPIKKRTSLTETNKRLTTEQDSVEIDCIKNNSSSDAESEEQDISLGTENKFVSSESRGTRKMRSFSDSDSSSSKKGSHLSRKGSEHKVKKAILAIEDEKVLRTIIPSYVKRALQIMNLNPNDYETIFAKTGEEGILLHLLHNPFLTLVDFNLEGVLKGDQVVDSIRQGCQESNGLRKPGYLVGISAQRENNEKMKTESSMQKPLKFDLFHQTLQNALNPSVKHDKEDETNDLAHDNPEKKKGDIQTPGLLSPKDNTIDN